MNVIVDLETTEVELIGCRTVNNITRWYYTVHDCPDCLLVTHNAPLEIWRGDRGVALVDIPDSTILCDVLPKAPQIWRNKKITQYSIKKLKDVRGYTILLSEMVKYPTAKAGGL